jgi:lipopolysaccharide biosynthesis glycosyltransferase
MHRIFIGYDTRQDISYHVLKYSLEKHSSEELDIRPLVLKELDFHRDYDPLASTEFTYTRFLVPSLCDYEGTALFMDSDMLCFGDISEIFHLDMSDYWLRVVKHDHRPTTKVKMDGVPQTAYPRKNWSSFMLFDCSRLTMWTRGNVSEKPPKWLHRFEPVPDECIGDIPRQWNVLDRKNEDTKLIHYTEGGPWLENYKDHAYGDLWFECRDQMLALQRASASGMK